MIKKRVIAAAILIAIYIFLIAIKFHHQGLAPFFCLAIALVMFVPLPGEHNREDSSEADH